MIPVAQSRFRHWSLLTWSNIIALIFSANCASSKVSNRDLYERNSICRDGDCISGHGKILVRQRYLYSGQFKSGLPHGVGSLSVQNREIFTGPWLEGLPESKEEREVIRELFSANEGPDGLEEIDRTGSLAVSKSSIICTAIWTILAWAPRICIMR